MREELPGLTDRWASVGGGAINIGIGVSTGMAQVGNAGSSYRLKYGPRGHTVNLASRLESATKWFELPVLISGSTQGYLGDSFATRRLCKVSVAGTSEPVDLFELCVETADKEWQERRDAYELALSHYEAEELAAACAALVPITSGKSGNKDFPSKFLLKRASDVVRQDVPFDPVLHLEQK